MGLLEGEKLTEFITYNFLRKWLHPAQASIWENLQGNQKASNIQAASSLKGGWIYFEYFNSTTASSTLQRASGQRQD